MVAYSAQTDESALVVFGRRLAAFRVRNNWTQADLAQKAGVGKGTVERIERGESVQVLNLVKVLRACGTLDVFMSLFPDESPSPMQLLYMGKVKKRQRARSSGKSASDAKTRGASDFFASDVQTGYGAESDSGAPAQKTSWVWDEDK